MASARLQRRPEQQHIVRLAALALCRAHATCNTQQCCEELPPQTAYRHAAEVELLEGGLGGGVAGLELRGRRPVSWYAPCIACISTASLAFLGIMPISGIPQPPLTLLSDRRVSLPGGGWRTCCSISVVDTRLISFHCNVRNPKRKRMDFFLLPRQVQDDHPGEAEHI